MAGFGLRGSETGFRVSPVEENDEVVSSGGIVTIGDFVLPIAATVFPFLDELSED